MLLPVQSRQSKTIVIWTFVHATFVLATFVHISIAVSLFSLMLCSPQVLSPLLLLFLCVGVQAGPDIQLAGFEDLFRLATAGMADREDRSLLNSYPFNHVASQVSFIHDV